MNCTLMHKRIATAQIELDDESGFIRRVQRILRPEHLPVGVTVKKGSADRAALNEWWLNRSIPASRMGIREALELLHLPDTKTLLMCCFGLSLSDQYWMKPEGSGLRWEDINFFDHDFSMDIGDALFGSREADAGFDFSSPDNTSDGFLKKRWKIIDGRRCLIKGGSNPFQQQPFNEVIACRIMEQLGIIHVPYSIVWSDGLPYSVCEDFVTPDTELVSAWRLMKTLRKDNSTSVYQHFIRCCEELGVRGIQHSLDQMIVLDYLIANEDRHLNNFGLLRCAQTLEWLGFAPIYDSGSSLGFDKSAAHILAGYGISCKPFKNSHEQQLGLVSSFDWIDFSKLSDCGIIIEETFSRDGAPDYLDGGRIRAIAASVMERVQKLEKESCSTSRRVLFQNHKI